VDKEEWKPILERNDYEISSTGRFRHIVHGEFRYIKIKQIPSGYMQVNYFLNGKRQYRYAHRLVAEAFVKNPEKLPWVNHIDGVKTNNDASNLEWVTPSTNTSHGFRTGLNHIYPHQREILDRRNRETKSKRIEQLTIDGVLVKTWYNACDMAKETVFDRSTIAMAARKGYVRYGFRWRYVA
jgi:hypothetical protein